MTCGDPDVEVRSAAFAALEHARAIGDEILATAIVAGDRATWIGRDPSELLDPKATLTPTARSLGGELYGGTAGVALFLAELDACASADPARGRIARAALAHALDQARRRNGRLGVGLYDGLAGIGHAAIRIGERYDDRGAIAAGLELLQQAAVEAAAAHVLDVIGGLAGVILALAYHAPRHAQLARPLAVAGESLLAESTVRERVWHWPPTPGFGAPRHLLTGFSHGASGIATALLALHAANGNPEAYRGAVGTLRYEDGWFVAEERNWPDLRSYEGATLPARRKARRALTYARTWCHGAPGILLTRALAANVGVDNQERDTLALALATTIDEAAAWVPGADVTPCHGATGLVDCLLHAPGDRARVAADELLRRVVTAKCWTSGVPSGGTNQSLMLGMAGVGYQLLRHHDLRIPSILMVM